ncbi:hypothetical protein [Wolbachia endosymbiont of Ctenocephalides felis wCfeT]|nr:hypothetical protein [Wolbachia endosymbiont of Ctenocephalides felis wCfeT]
MKVIYKHRNLGGAGIVFLFTVPPTIFFGMYRSIGTYDSSTT